jgi:hypothetical protein
MENAKAQFTLNPADCGANRCVKTNGDFAYSRCTTACAGDNNCESDEECKSANELRADAVVRGIEYNDPCCGNDAFCFSSVASTNVLKKGKTLVKDLQIGDEVLTASGGYKQVYTVDHKHPEKASEFLQIYTSENDEESPLEITKSHFVFLHNKIDPVPAGQVQVGDALQVASEQPAVVTKISSVIRDGLWNPITEDGTIVVDGVVTSTYTALNLISNGNTHSTYLEVGGYKIMSIHDFIHLLMTPYRTMCVYTSASFCDAADDEEFSSYSKFGNQFLKVSKQLHPMIQNIIALGAVLLFSVLYLIIMNPLATAILSVSYAYLCHHTTSNSNKKYSL